jgi:hypothetical protein
VNLPINVEKYLRNKSAGTWKLEPNNFTGITTTVVIPVIAESKNIPMLLNSLNRNNPSYLKRTAIIFIVNNTSSSQDEVKIDNLASLLFIRNAIDKNEYPQLNLRLIDASSRGNELPERDGGVGLARKIGMDLALTIFDYFSNEKKILICLDADCTVSTNYIETIISGFNKRNLNAASIHFEHDAEQAENPEAITCYEIFLRYYVLGLKYARSPFAFHTIGSSMACDFESYINIGGMNKKKAAEDFYFLEKLGKVVTVESIDSAVVYPSSRGSWRVPFGTGQRVNRFIARTHDEYSLYSPDSFIVLKEWLAFLNSTKDASSIILSEAKKIHSSLYSFLLEQKFEQQWNSILSNAKAEGQLSIQKKLWFDGFKTLKFIHYLRDNAYPNINMFDACDKLFELLKIGCKIERDESIPPLVVQKNYLELLRKINYN